MKIENASSVYFDMRAVLYFFFEKRCLFVIGYVFQLSFVDDFNFSNDAFNFPLDDAVANAVITTAKEVNDVTQSTDEINDLTIYDINVNIEIGCNYLASLITRYNGNYYLAICAYNAGIGNVNKWLDQGLIPYDLDTTDIELPFNETTNYLKKVIKSYKAYKRVYPSLS